MQTDYPPNVPWQHAPEQQYPVMPPQPPTPQPGVVWLPPVANDRTNFGLLGICSIILATMFIPQGIANFVGSHLPLLTRLGMLIFFYLLPILAAAFGVLVFKQQRRWNRVNQRRQMAAAYGFASGVPLAEPQPFPNIEALPQQFIIKLKINWFALFALVCLVICTSLLIWLDFSISSDLFFGATLQESVADLSHFWGFPFLIIFPALITLVRPLVPPQRIEIAPEGLTVIHAPYDWASNKHQYKKQMIYWSEARLFAIRIGKPGATKVRSELSSPATVVTFSRIVRPRWWSLYRPAQPFGEYNAQMDALLALISARTGLLLYDVRQAPSTEVHPKGISPSTFTIVSEVLVGLSFACQVEGFPGVLFAKLHNDGRPVALLIEIIAGLLALGGLGFGYRVRVPAYKTRLLRLGVLCLAFAILGLILFPFGPFIVH